MSLLYVVVRVRCRRKESSRSLSHLLMSLLLTVCVSENMLRILLKFAAVVINESNIQMQLVLLE